jgi:hypothetical protein
MSIVKKIVVSIEIVTLGWLALSEDLRWIGLVFLGLLGVAGCSLLISANWPIGALLTLVAASAVPRVVWSVAGLHVHPEHFAIGAILLAILCRRPKNPWRLLNLQSFDYLLLGYIVLNFFSSAFASPEPSKTLRWAALQALVIAPYFLIRFLVTNTDTLRKMWRCVLVVGAIESLYGSICFLSNRSFGSKLGVEVEQYGHIPGTYGTQYEANLFGSYTGCSAIMFLAAFLMSRDQDRKWYLYGFIISTFAMSISLSRAVLLSFPVAMLFVFWITSRTQRFEPRRLLRIAVVAAAGLLVASPLLVPMVRERFENIDFTDVTSDQTTVERLIQTKVAMDNIIAHPVWGSGTASFQLFFNWEDYLPEMGDVAGWLGNTPLRILHDTGIVGLIVFLTFLGTLAWAGRSIKNYPNATSRVVVVTLASGVVLYAMTFQATEATTLAFTWVHLGLLANGIILVKETQTLSSRA